MKKYLSLILIFTVAFAMVSCGGDEPGKPDKPETEKPTEPETPGGSDKPDEPGKPDEPSGNGKILVAYFSWGETTRRMAQQISQQTGATLFEIEPVTPLSERIHSDYRSRASRKEFQRSSCDKSESRELE